MIKKTIPILMIFVFLFSFMAYAEKELVGIEYPTDYSRQVSTNPLLNWLYNLFNPDYSRTGTTIDSWCGSSCDSYPKGTKNPTGCSCWNNLVLCNQRSSSSGTCSGTTPTTPTQPTTPTTPSIPTTCFDSDGYDIYNRGYTGINGGKKYDSCYDTFTVIEGECEGDVAKYYKTTCGYQCLDGRCIVQPSPTPTTKYIKIYNHDDGLLNTISQPEKISKGDVTILNVDSHGYTSCSCTPFSSSLYRISCSLDKINLEVIGEPENIIYQTNCNFNYNSGTDTKQLYLKGIPTTTPIWYSYSCKDGKITSTSGDSVSINCLYSTCKSTSFSTNQGKPIESEIKDKLCQSGTTTQKCIDGTNYGECSTTRPKFCCPSVSSTQQQAPQCFLKNPGTLVDSASDCGCPANLIAYGNICSEEKVPELCSKDKSEYCSDNFDLSEIITPTSVKQNEIFSASIKVKNRNSMAGRMFVECGIYPIEFKRTLKFGEPEYVQNCISTEKNVNSADIALRGNQEITLSFGNIQATNTNPGDYILSCSTYEVCNKDSWIVDSTGKRDSRSSDIEQKSITLTGEQKNPDCYYKYLEYGATDYGCGGKCDKCDLGKQCKVSSDCKSNYCKDNVCQESVTTKKKYNEQCSFTEECDKGLKCSSPLFGTGICKCITDDVCPTDGQVCYDGECLDPNSNIIPWEIESPDKSITVSPGDDISIKLKVKNIGTKTGNKYVEAALVTNEIAESMKYYPEIKEKVPEEYSKRGAEFEKKLQSCNKESFVTQGYFENINPQDIKSTSSSSGFLEWLKSDTLKKEGYLTLKVPTKDSKFVDGTSNYNEKGEYVLLAYTFDKCYTKEDPNTGASSFSLYRDVQIDWSKPRTDCTEDGSWEELDLYTRDDSLTYGCDTDADCCSKNCVPWKQLGVEITSWYQTDYDGLCMSQKESISDQYYQFMKDTFGLDKNEAVLYPIIILIVLFIISQLRRK